jgi:outer membrane receptor protein involved in Fe transport
VALLFDPLDSVRLRLGYGQSYRTPSLRDLYQPPVPNLGGAYFLAGNPDLETESAFGLRLGLEWTPLDWLSFSATSYENQIDDFIRSGLAGSIQVGTRYDPAQLPPESLICRTRPDDPRCLPSAVPLLRSLYRKSNLDQVRTRGIDLQINSRPLAGVSLKLGYGFLRTEVDSKTLIDLEELPNEPRHTFDAEATWTLPRVETAFSVRARWRDEALIETSGTGLSSFTSLEHSDPSWVVDLRFVQPLFRGISLYLDVENLTNEKVIDSYEIRARTLFLGLRYELEPSGR